MEIVILCLLHSMVPFQTTKFFFLNNLKGNQATSTHIYKSVLFPSHFPRSSSISSLCVTITTLSAECPPPPPEVKCQPFTPVHTHKGYIGPWLFCNFKPLPRPQSTLCNFRLHCFPLHVLCCVNAQSYEHGILLPILVTSLICPLHLEFSAPYSTHYLFRSDLNVKIPHKLYLKALMYVQALRISPTLLQRT